MPNYRNFDVFKLDPISEIKNAGITTAGSVIWVKAVGDPDYVTVQDQVGSDLIRNTFQEAVTLARNDTDDYIFVVPQTTNTDYTIGTALDINKDRVHFKSVSNKRSKQSYSVTLRGNYGTTPDTEVVNLTGDGVTWEGIRTLGTLGTHAGGTMSNGVFLAAGLDFWARDAVFECNQNIWGTPPVLRGSGTAAHDARFDDCMFAVTGTGNVEAAANAGLVYQGDGNQRWEFNKCVFTLPAGSTTETFLTAGTGPTRYLMLNQCNFLLRNGTAFLITSAIRGSVTANNPILSYYSAALSCTALGTDPNVLCVPNDSGTAGAGVHNPMLYLRGSAPVTAA